MVGLIRTIRLIRTTFWRFLSSKLAQYPCISERTVSFMDKSHLCSKYQLKTKTVHRWLFVHKRYWMDFVIVRLDIKVLVREPSKRFVGWHLDTILTVTSLSESKMTQIGVFRGLLENDDSNRKTETLSLRDGFRVWSLRHISVVRLIGSKIETFFKN